jgi:hypothetical protein
MALSLMRPGSSKGDKAIYNAEIDIAATIGSGKSTLKNVTTLDDNNSRERIVAQPMDAEACKSFFDGFEPGKEKEVSLFGEVRVYKMATFLIDIKKPLCGQNILLT